MLQTLHNRSLIECNQCRYAPQLVRKVVRDLLERLERPALHVADMPVDVDQRVAVIKRQLAQHSASGPAVLGLYGMGGIGKTTLASAVFNDLRTDFVDASCFVEVGRDADKQQLQQLQRQMLRELCGIPTDISSNRAGRPELESRLSSACVLLVIDDIWRKEQLDALLVGVGRGSRVLVTTRDRALLDRPSVTLQQPVDVLSGHAALEVFCWQAFLQGAPPAGYEGHAADAAQACSGLPLALTVTGAHLWSKKSLETWDQALHNLQRAKPFAGGKTADDALWGQLLLSYDDLDSEEQQMFLDITCVMLGKDAMMCLPAWGHPAHSNMENLKNRCLVSVDKDGNLAVHDQLRDMGRAKVIKEHRIAGQRSRVWMPEAQKVIQNKQVRLSALPHAHGLPCLMPHARGMLLHPPGTDYGQGVPNKFFTMIIALHQLKPMSLMRRPPV